MTLHTVQPPQTPPASAPFVTRRIREIYGPTASAVALTTTSMGTSLRVMDEGMTVLPFPDDAPWGVIDELLDLCGQHYGPGLSDLAEDAPVALLSLDDLFGVAPQEAQAAPAKPPRPAARQTRNAAQTAEPEWLPTTGTHRAAVGA